MKPNTAPLLCPFISLLCIFQAPLPAQEIPRDTIAIGKSHKKIEFLCTGGAGQYAPTGNDKVLVPNVIWKQRVANDPYGRTTQIQTDDPFRHAVFWSKTEASVRIFHRNTFSVGFLAEHRGESFGVYSFKNLAILPIIRIEVDDSIRIFKKTYSIKAKTGYIEKVFIDQGLLFYNIDAQGSLVSLRRNHYAIEYDVLGDMIAGIGLGIDDAVMVRIKRFNLFKQDHNLAFTVSKFTRVPNLATFESRLMPSLSYDYTYGDVKIGAQIAWRRGNPKTPIPGHPKIQGSERLGVKAGISYAVGKKNLVFKGAFDCRYYGRFFNIDNYTPNRTYRDYTRPLYGNYTGQHLYPVKNYFYDFSQLAVFTEYGIREIGAMALVSQVDLRLWGKFWCTNKFDLNFLAVEKTTPFLYPFYRSGLTVKFTEDARLELMITNKTMNLDVHYNTFYLTQKPFYGVTFYYRNPV